MNWLQFGGMLATALVGGGGIAALLTAINNRKLTAAQAGGAEAESERTEQETRTLVLKDARDQLAESKKACDLCNQRLSRRDVATYRLLDVLEQDVVPQLSEDGRIKLREAARGMREAMYDRPAS